MCVELIGEVIAVSADGTCRVDFGDGRPHVVSLVILETEGEPVTTGDRVAVHTGIAVRRCGPLGRDAPRADEA